MIEAMARQMASEIEARFPHIHTCVTCASMGSASWIVGLFSKKTYDSLGIVISGRVDYHTYLSAYRAFAGLPDDLLPVEAELERQFQEEIASWHKKEA